MSKKIVKLKALESILKGECYCYLCGLLIISPKHMNLDHIFPKSKGGKAISKNLRPAHIWCNSEKADLTIEQYCIMKGWLSND